MNAGVIEAGELVSRRKLDETAASWVQRLAALPAEPSGDPVERSEGLWLVSHFVGRGERAPGLFLPASACRDPAEVAQRVRERMGWRERASENMRDTGARTGDVES